jgi:hypothetical protein
VAPEIGDLRNQPVFGDRIKGHLGEVGLRLRAFG